LINLNAIRIVQYILYIFNDDYQTYRLLLSEDMLLFPSLCLSATTF